ncbi:hypothetical protein [Rhizobium leguminosarum]|uniref:hypothetical protein n=1 Tax=Rhizobium leguminosarum TaxID=384 RepID=UPI003F9C8EE4
MEVDSASGSGRLSRLPAIRGDAGLAVDCPSPAGVTSNNRRLALGKGRLVFRDRKAGSHRVVLARLTGFVRRIKP